MRQPIKIPTIIGILLILTMISAVAFIFERIPRTGIKASPTTVPNQVEITNISDASLTISWTTQDPATGALIVEGPDRKKQTVFDERDATRLSTREKLGKYTTHSVTLRNLTPATQYSVRILSGDKPFLDNGKPYIFTTGSTTSGAGTGLEPAFGSVVTAGNQPAEGALVYLTLEGSQKLSTLVKPSGSWLVSLNTIRTMDLSSYIAASDRVTETLMVRFNSMEALAITDTLNDAPVPTMMMGKTYDFRKIQAKTGQQLAMAPSAVLGQNAQGVVGITRPTQGAAIPSNLPLITGTGLPGREVVVTVGITNPVSGKAAVGGDGIWRFTPSQPLAPGKQSVTITTTDANDKPVAITHLFNVLKEGTQVLGEATPSGTLTPTAIPTVDSSPTPTSTLTGEPVPTSGSLLPVLLLMLLGLGLIVGGSFAFIL